MLEIEKKYVLREKGEDFATDEFYKFYPTIDDFVEDVRKNGTLMRQGYLPLDQGLSLMLELGIEIPFRPSEAKLRYECLPDEEMKYYYTLKSSGFLKREKIEQEIPREIFEEYWVQTKGQRIRKKRTNAFEVTTPEGNFRVDAFVYVDGRDLVMIEVEVPSKKIAKQLTPLGKDVTDDFNYLNKNLGF